jgi:hypothetical protein
MINLFQNEANVATLDLTINSNYWVYSSITPFFLFSFTGEGTNQIINFVTDNIAPISARTTYDQFIITETGSTFTNLTGGCINLSVGNTWIYQIYEQLTRNNLIPASALDVVGYGRVTYNPNVTNNYTFFTGNTQNNIFFTSY